MPVVFMFHGTGQDGAHFFDNSGWKEKADQEGFIAVFPTALPYCYHKDGRQRHETKWLSDRFFTIACDGQSFNDDILFVRLMIDYLRQRYRIDDGRLFASGFSNGGGFVTTRLAVEATDLFAAVTTAGTFPDPSEEERAEVISAFHVLGGADDGLLERTGASSLAAWVEGAFYASWIQEVLAPLHLAYVEDRVATPQQLSLHYTTSLIGYDNELRLSIIKDLDHRYPSALVDQFWPFYETYPRKTGL